MSDRDDIRERMHHAGLTAGAQPVAADGVLEGVVGPGGEQGGAPGGAQGGGQEAEEEGIRVGDLMRFNEMLTQGGAGVGQQQGGANPWGL